MTLSPSPHFRAAGLRAGRPPGGIRSALAGGNTIGGWIREAEARADGYRHVDTLAMISLLTSIGANHYCFGIWDSPTDFDDLRNEFAPAAQAAGIQLMPYIVPPSETFSWGKSSQPYVMDYIAWARAFAELSLTYPVLTAWAIDDFDWAENPAVFTPDYLARIREAQLAVNPRLGLFTCAYITGATSDDFMIKYGPYLDGIVFPYLDGHNFNTIRPDRLRTDLDTIVELTRRYDLEVIVLAYAGRWLAGLLEPTAEYVSAIVTEAATRAASGEILGVISYGLQVDGAPAVANGRRSMYGDGRGALLAPVVPVDEGQYAELSTRLEVQPDSPRHELGFWHSRTTSIDHVPERGDYRIDVLIDDAVVWTADAHDSTWQQLWVFGRSPQGAFDVSESLRGKTEATLTFRLTAVRDVGGACLDVGLDAIETIGFTLADPGFEDPAAWQTVDSNGQLVAVVDRYQPDRPDRILHAVRHVYSAVP